MKNILRSRPQTVANRPTSGGWGNKKFFFSASYAAIIFTGNRQNSEGNVNSYLFSLYIGLIMYKSVQLHA